MAGNPPVDVQQFGQSIWYDNIRRQILKNGELQRMIEQEGILGVTSNPSIFQKAIGASNDYDDAIEDLLDLDPYQIYEKLAIEDIQNALDLFRPTYERTNGGDGYVSLEVSPLIANDTESTVQEAKRLYETVNRPNVMIKIPATEAGIPAIEEAIAAGININVTLIFGVENYERVAEAYIRGLERRVDAGLDVTQIASVASFFLSRIDTAVDRVLDNNIRAAQGRDVTKVALNNKLKGKAAIANAKLAYQKFQEIFYGPRFEKARTAGARPQRVLWASTSTKNPAYPDTMYIDALIGAETVNTVPPDALLAFKEHGMVAQTLTQGTDELDQIFTELAEVGIDLKSITDSLQVDGVASFSDSFNALLDQVDAKRNVLATGVFKQQTLNLGARQAEVDAAIKTLDAQHANKRIWEHDGTLWKDNPNVATKINNRLGWLDTNTTIDYERLHALQAEVKNSVITDVVLLGMGGSSLAPEVLYKTFGNAEGFPKLHMLDSTDPVYIASIENAVDLNNTLFIVASKSGSTIETASFYEYFYERTGQKGQQFIAITDGGSDLEKLGHEKGFREVFVNPSDIGGRYSALSYFGLVPATLLGLDLNALRESAKRMMVANAENISSNTHPALILGAVMAVFAQNGQDKLTLHTSPSIHTFGNWVEQLVAESTGKEGRGILPVVGATIGKPHDYSTDRLFVYLRLEGDDNDATDNGLRVLKEAGHSMVTLNLNSKYDLGGEFFRWEYATAVAGKVLDINPFDEPNVTESKQNTSRLLEYYQANGKLPETSPIATDETVSLYADSKTTQVLKDLCKHHHFDANSLVELIAAQINVTEAGDYFAVLAYVPQFDDITESLEEVRRRLRHVTRRATTIGFGPRFLHSTGQLHKGGANNGIFIQITTDHEGDLAIPNAPYTFGTLKAAQAAGDLEALQSKDRRALRLHIQGDVIEGLQKLLKAIDLAGERRV